MRASGAATRGGGRGWGGVRDDRRGAGVDRQGEDCCALEGVDGRLGGEDEVAERPASAEAKYINGLFVDVSVDIEQKLSARDAVTWR